MSADFNPHDHLGRLRDISDAERASLPPERRALLDGYIGAKNHLDKMKADHDAAKKTHAQESARCDALIAHRNKLFPPLNRIDEYRNMVWASSMHRPHRRGDPPQEK